MNSSRHSRVLQASPASPASGHLTSHLTPPVPKQPRQLRQAKRAEQASTSHPSSTSEDVAETRERTSSGRDKRRGRGVGEPDGAADSASGMGGADNLWTEEEVDIRHANASAQLRMLRGRLQLDTPPSYTTMTLRLTRLVVPGEARLSRRGRPFSVNVGLMGMLHPPSVTPIPGTDTYRVITGRGRVIGARLLGEPETLECHCYERLSRTDETLLILSENMRHAPAWAQEVAALAELVDTRVGMTEQELAILFGLSVTTIRERLKLALLLPGIRSQVTSGTVGYAVARRITRLTEAAKALLEDQAQDGETITEDMVRQAMRGQIGAGMGVVRQALVESWSPWDAAATWSEGQAVQESQCESQVDASVPGAATKSSCIGTPSTLTNISGKEEATEATAAKGAVSETWNHSTFEYLTHELLRLERMLAHLPGAARASMLAQALQQELMILQRTIPAMPPTADSEASMPKAKPRSQPGRTTRAEAESAAADLSLPAVRADDVAVKA